MECHHEKSNPQGHEGYQADCLEALIIMCAKSRIAEDTARKITSIWANGIRMLEHWCYFNLPYIWDRVLLNTPGLNLKDMHRQWGMHPEQDITESCADLTDSHIKQINIQANSLDCVEVQGKGFIKVCVV